MQTGRFKHRFSHPPEAPPGRLWNKPAHNLEHGGLPFIGTVAELWPEYLASRLLMHDVGPLKARCKVGRFLRRLERPVIVTHFEGATNKELKYITGHEQAEIVRGLPGSFVPCSNAKTVEELFLLIQGRTCSLGLTRGLCTCVA